MCAPILTDDKRNDKPGDSGGLQNAPTTQKTPFVAMHDMLLPNHERNVANPDLNQLTGHGQNCNNFPAISTGNFRSCPPRHFIHIVRSMIPAEQVGNRVLVVDDNQVVAHSLLRLLRSEGFDPHVFQSGQPALDYIREHRPDFALIDIHLADFSGLEISRELRQTHGADLPIIIFSGDSSIETLRALPEAGTTLFLSKPINATVLLDYLRNATAGKSKIPLT
jgi:CheY-like chemotaxis protein